MGSHCTQVAPPSYNWHDRLGHDQLYAPMGLAQEEVRGQHQAASPSHSDSRSRGVESFTCQCITEKVGESCQEAQGGEQEIAWKEF